MKEQELIWLCNLWKEEVKSFKIPKGIYLKEPRFKDTNDTSINPELFWGMYITSSTPPESLITFWDQWGKHQRIF